MTFIALDTIYESCIKVTIFLWLVSGHFQQIKMSNMGISVVLSNYFIFYAGSLYIPTIKKGIWGE